MEQEESAYPQWFVELREQLPNASPDTLKVILEHTTKLLDHSYAANEVLSQKARWGIGIVVAVVAVLLKSLLDSLDKVSPTLSWATYGPGLLCLGVAFVLFIIVSLTYDQHHSGMEPQLNNHGNYIAHGTFDMQHPDYEGTNKQLDLGYVVLWTIWDYQQRITKSQNSVRKSSKLFNWGAWTMIAGVLYILSVLSTLQ